MNSLISTPKSSLDTPSLLLDLDAFERNLNRMQAFLDQHGVNLRPHFKAHRTPEITRRQIERGAKGVTCAKLGEAEHLASLGFDGFLVANQVVGENKMRRLTELARQSEVIVAMDSEEAVSGTAEAAQRAGVVVNAVIEVDIGMSRCGVPPFEPTLKLAQSISRQRGLRFRGIMGYEGHLVDKPAGDEKAQGIRASVKLLTDTADILREKGIPVEIVSSGGTGSYQITATCKGVTELQCGTYSVGDIMFGQVGSGFDCAAIVLGTVVSKPSPDRVVTDCGMKALQSQFGFPAVRSHAGWKLQPLSAEHGQLKKFGPGPELRIGDKVEFAIFYADGNINLHERWLCIRGDKVVDVWEISGRGKSQ